ncbi:precorrin-3B synthase [Saccharopolyspora sp. MS10]|uniref:precorrin-3B synthase n=1 Tax=Saccharopolyspora sp. MS10 TaxID=3385973 RepID=UPI0039A0F9AC
MPRRAEPDRCPGALRVHEAADGGLARVRVPGGRLSARQVRAVAAAAELGDGGWELTSRANLQVRGLAASAVPEFAARLAESGLLPSPTHERVRNVIASPHTGCDELAALDAGAVAVELDELLCAEPALAELPGRFLFTVDDGRGDVAGLGADVGLVPAGGAVAVLLSGADEGIRVAAADAARAAVLAAGEFLVERARQGAASWRLAELSEGTGRVAGRLRAALGSAALGSTAPVSAVEPMPTHAGLGARHRRDGLVCLALGAPLGRCGAAQVRVLAELGRPLRLTPWRALLLPDVPETAAPRLLSELDGAGFLVDAADPLAGVTSCAGSPGCAKSLADVRADAARVARPGPRPVHWAGCERRCGRPAGDAVLVLATGSGYEVGGAPAGEVSAALDAARRAV